MKHFTLCLVLLGWGIGLHAQEVEGVVQGTFEQHEAPLFKAKVVAGDSQTRTDSSGNFLLETGASQSIIAKCKGYHADTQNIQAAQNSYEFTLKASSEATSTSARFEVFGMGCPGCHEGLEKQLKELPQVIEATANWEKKEVSIQLMPCTALRYQDFREAVEKANLTPGERLAADKKE